MRGVLFTAMALLLSAQATGCVDSDLEGLEGRWQGTIYCYEGESDLTLGLQIEGDKLVGTAQIRAKENNTSWTVSGKATKSCEQDTCRTDKDCPSSSGEPRTCGGAVSSAEANYNPVCIEQMKQRNKTCTVTTCDPCQDCLYCLRCSDCQQGWLPLQITLSDQAVIMPDPQLKLWRYSEITLRGTIEQYCTNSTTIRPEVALHRD